MDLKARIVIILVLVSMHVPTRAAAQQVPSHFIGGPNEDTFFEYLRPTLRASKYAGRVDYSGACKIGGLEFVTFPQIGVHPPKSSTALNAVREMFQGDAEVQVAEEPHKIISIRVGQPLTAILDTKISLIKLAPIAQYNPRFAIGAIENAPEVKAAIDKLGLRIPVQPLQFFAELYVKPAPGLPHLHAAIKDATVGQVLSLMAKTFQGIVTYGTCAQPEGKGMVEINFIGLD